jgi:hypothetical protein
MRSMNAPKLSGRLVFGRLAILEDFNVVAFDTNV